MKTFLILCLLSGYIGYRWYTFNPYDECIDDIDCEFDHLL